MTTLLESSNWRPLDQVVHPSRHRRPKRTEPGDHRRPSCSIYVKRSAVWFYASFESQNKCMVVRRAVLLWTTQVYDHEAVQRSLRTSSVVAVQFPTILGP